jgi:hypothetical protein
MGGSLARTDGPGKGHALPARAQVPAQPSRCASVSALRGSIVAATDREVSDANEDTDSGPSTRPSLAQTPTRGASTHAMPSTSTAFLGIAPPSQDLAE